MTKVNFKQAMASVPLVCAFSTFSASAMAQGQSSAQQLDGGFVAGMTPEQTCAYFKAKLLLSEIGNFVDKCFKPR
jgi:hypothetical protein